jgi:deazaflavin-dependent oxidoreductase (nitroreductase family)
VNLDAARPAAVPAVVRMPTLAGVRDRTDPMTPFQERLGRFTIQTMTGLNNVAYRLSKGRVGGNTPRGAPICLLTTTGRKTGRMRTVSLVYLADGEDLVVVASLGGMSHHPSWYLNLMADPVAVVQDGDRTLRVVARVATPAERDRFWPPLIDSYEHFASYQIRTDREIPLVVLSPCPT